MSHHHEHHHHAHAHTHTANKKVLRVSFIIIAAFMLLEAVGGWLTHSLALLSDAGHMFSDAFSLGVALWAFKLGEKETTLQKTFGYKRFEILTAMFNGLSLVVIAVLIFYEAVKRLLYPPEIATLGMLVISVVGLLVNIGVAVYMLKNSDTEANVNMRGAYLHVKRPSRLNRRNCRRRAHDGVRLEMGGPARQRVRCRAGRTQRLEPAQTDAAHPHGRRTRKHPHR